MWSPVICAALIVMCAGAFFLSRADSHPVPVTVNNFVRAETDFYFANTVKDGAFGKFLHNRQMTPIDQQIIVRMNRDTIYSAAVFDLSASPVTITLPDPGKRYMSLQAISEDHHTISVVYAPGHFTFSETQVETRYLFLIVRILADPQDPADLRAANALQDGIRVEQASIGTFEIPDWDAASQAKVRDALAVLGSTTLGSAGMFGNRNEVDPVLHLIGTAVGWGGNPRSAAMYTGASPKENDGRTVYRLTLKDVPVDGFWSVSVYNAKGYFEKNAMDAYSLNSLTAKPSADGSYTVQFGGCGEGVRNCLPITPGWNYTVRLYRPRKEVLDGRWTVPEPQPVE